MRVNIATMEPEPETQVSDRQSWLAQRRGGIGGSDAATIHGASPFQTAYQLWLDKTGRVAPEDEDPIKTPHLFWGAVLEAGVREGYAKLTGRTVGPGVKLLRHPGCEAMLANTDGTVTTEGQIIVELDDGVVVEREAPGEGVYEGKLTTLFRRQEWEAGIPLYYVVQCQHYCAVTGHQWASLGVFIAGERQPLRARDMLRHESFISKHVNMCGEWWERHVVKDEPPPLDDRKRTESMIRRAYPDATPKLIAQLDEAFAAKQRRLSEVESAIKKLEAERQQIRNEVMAAIGEASAGALPDGSGWTFKTQTTAGYTKTVPPNTYRVLRYSKRVSKTEEA